MFSPEKRGSTDNYKLQMNIFSIKMIEIKKRRSPERSC